MYVNRITKFLFQKTFKNNLNSSQKDISSILKHLILYWQGAEICKEKQSVVPKIQIQHTKRNQFEYSLCLLKSNSQPTAAWR